MRNYVNPRSEYILYYMLIIPDFSMVDINNSLVNDMNDLKGVNVKALDFMTLFRVLFFIRTTVSAFSLSAFSERKIKLLLSF